MKRDHALHADWLLLSYTWFPFQALRKFLITFLETLVCRGTHSGFFEENVHAQHWSYHFLFSVQNKFWFGVHPPPPTPNNDPLCMNILWHVCPKQELWSREKQALIGNRCVSTQHQVTVGSGVFYAFRDDATSTNPQLLDRKKGV
jgi:hypothetical protein